MSTAELPELPNQTWLATAGHDALIVYQTAAEYHADRFRVSRSQIVSFLESPYGYFKQHIERNSAWQKKSTSAMDFGSACHEAIFIHRDAMQAFAVIPDDVLNNDGAKVGKAYLAWKRENPGKLYLKEQEAASWLEMWAAIQDSATASKLLMGNYHDALAEFTIHWTFEGVDLRARIDRYIPGFAIIDLKTCNNADEHAIVREIIDRKLHIQAGVYQWAVELATGEKLPFIFVFVEKSAPFRVVCREIPQDWIDDGMLQVWDGLRRMQRCADSGEWPRNSDPEIRPVTRPRYDTKPSFQETLD